MAEKHFAKIELTDGNIIIRPCRREDAAVICEGVQETMHEMLKWGAVVPS